MDTQEAPGAMMRRLRMQRKLTLRIAASILDISPSALSRLERDLHVVERSDIEAVIQGYGLHHWEASQLAMCAGFAPLPPSDGEAKADWLLLTEHLRTLMLPAFVLDELNYVVAWNGPAQAVWQLPSVPAAPFSPLDDLFSERVRRLLGDSWLEASHALYRHLYLRTLRVAGDQRLHRALSSVARKHGRLFIDHWNAAMEDGAGNRAGDSTNIVLRVETREGAIDYILLRSAAHNALSIDLYVQVPLDSLSADRHERLMASAAIGNVVRCRDGRLR